MTGLDLGSDALIEVAALVTDPDLNVLGDGVDVVIHADEAALAGMVEIVREMHDKSGLTDEVRALHGHRRRGRGHGPGVRDHATSPEPRTAPLCGNSIATDRGFIARDMPRLDAHLHYRMIDVSSIKELCRRWYPRVYFGQPAKGLAHRALADIRESIRELEYYRRDDLRAAARAGRRGGQGDRGAERLRPRAAGDTRSTGSHGVVWLSWSAPRGGRRAMVVVAQLVEHRVVVPDVAGSSPVDHPNSFHVKARSSDRAFLL